MILLLNVTYIKIGIKVLYRVIINWKDSNPNSLCGEDILVQFFKCNIWHNYIHIIVKERSLVIYINIITCTKIFALHFEPGLLTFQFINRGYSDYFNLRQCNENVFVQENNIIYIYQHYHEK